MIELAPEGFAPALLAGIDAGMALRVDDRPQSIVEWRNMLQSSTVPTHLVRKPGPLARAASKTRRTGITLRGPALLGAVAAAILLVAGGSYLAMTANAPSTLTTTAAALNLSAEQLEQALADRRKADTLASEKRRLEEEARQRAEADAIAKRQADEELERVRQARLKADQELAELKASIESRRQAGADPRDQAATAAQRDSEEAAQRKAEAEAAALRKAEEEAAKKAEADAEVKRQADQALAVAEGQRKQAEADAQAKAEAEAAARRQASAEAQRKAEVEAESRREADEAQAKAQAEREKAEAEATIKADAKAEADKAAAVLAKLKEEGEAAERSLRLEQPERQRLQVALTSLGFDTRGNDGVFGPRSRDMIAAWQKARNQPTTGFLTAAQRDVLLRAAAPAVARWDEEQKKGEESKADTGKLVTAASPAVPSPPPARPSLPTVTQPPSTGFDGAYSGIADRTGAMTARVTVSLQIVSGSGAGTLSAPGCSLSRFSVTISPTGDVSGDGYSNCIIFGINAMSTGPLKIDGNFRNKPRLVFRGERSSFLVMLQRGAAASLSPSSPDGLWRGTYTCGEGGGQWSGQGGPFTIDLTLKLDGSTSSGGGSNPSIANARTTSVEVSVNQKTVTVVRNWMGMNQHSQKSFLNGQLDGNTIRASGKENHSNRECTLALTRVP